MVRKVFLSLCAFAIFTLPSSAEDPFFNDPFGDNIFKEMMQMQRDMDRMFDRMHQRMRQRSSALMSPIGSYKITDRSRLVDKGNLYEVKTDIPKSKEGNVHISINQGVLNIEAKIIKKQESNQSGVLSYQSYMSMYQQRFQIPPNADESSMKSEYVDGYLTISFQKKSKKNTQVTKAKKDDNKTKK